MNVETKIFKRSVIQSLLTLPECINVVEKAFALHAEGNSLKPDLLHSNTENGEFHIKIGGLKNNKTYFGLKCNGGFFNNSKYYGLPNIQGLILLYDGNNGSPIAIFESGEITMQRTGAATAVAAKYLSLKNSDTAVICGCGTQGKIQLKSLLQVREIKNVFAFDRDENIMNNYVEEMTNELNIKIKPTYDLAEAVYKSQICVTCTPSNNYFIKNEFAHPGLFIAAVGADSPKKQEIDPHLIAKGKVVADILEQCAEVGELHHVIEMGLMEKEDTYSEIGEIIIGKKEGRINNNEVIIYDATGTAIQDIASAIYIYNKSEKNNLGLTFDFKM